MDIVSHALVGRLLASRETPPKETALLMGAAALPDLFQIPLYAYLGYLKARPFWIPENADWIGFRAAQPDWVLLWDIPHSVLFFVAAVVPLVLLLKMNRLVVLAYASHLVIDLFTHTGEWAVRPFWPHPLLVEGFTDAWAWNPIWFLVAWLILGLLIVFKDRLLQPGRAV
ncbi:MAG TPA: hypothetical protein PK954_04880 [Anaerolineales bacterium]|nr:hypothetical protein [Anaerolineales bacterium]HRF48818.1 hypothetical protein [Anaerolineales bacterium]